jgi:hypothetical protein
MAAGLSPTICVILLALDRVQPLVAIQRLGGGIWQSRRSKTGQRHQERDTSQQLPTKNRARNQFLALSALNFQSGLKGITEALQQP